MTRQEACVIVLKNHKFDGLLKDWLFASSKEEMIKARDSFCSIRACGGKASTMNRIKEELETAQAKSFYTLENTTTKQVTYHAIDLTKLSLRDWMINTLDMSCEYIPHEGYKKLN